jgi:hypothetical protein
MSFSSQKQPNFESAPADGLASRHDQANQQLQFPTRSQSQSDLQSPQQTQQSQPVCPWSAHAPPFGQSPSPLPRHAHTLSTSATAGGKLFLFGGYVPGSKALSNDLYVISTQDFSTTLVQTSGDVPSPRFGHCAVLTGATLVIWGGTTAPFSFRNALNQSNDDPCYLLNLGTSDLFHVKTLSS